MLSDSRSGLKYFWNKNFSNICTETRFRCPFPDLPSPKIFRAEFRSIEYHLPKKRGKKSSYRLQASPMNEAQGLSRPISLAAAFRPRIAANAWDHGGGYRFTVDIEGKQWAQRIHNKCTGRKECVHDAGQTGGAVVAKITFKGRKLF